MSAIDRRTALAIGIGAAAIVVADRSAAVAAVGDERKLAEGVTVKVLGEGPSIIPGFPKVRLRHITMQPGSSFPPIPMQNSMICHIVQGEIEVEQPGHGGKFTAKTDHVWSCTKGMSEGGANKGSTVAIMSVSDLLET